MLIATGLIILLLVAVACFSRDSLMFAMKTAIRPDRDFDTALLPAAPDYTTPEAWAAWPGEDSPANSRPLNADIQSEPSGVSVFFVHPTTYINKDNWNQPLTDEDANWIIA